MVLGFEARGLPLWCLGRWVGALLVLLVRRRLRVVRFAGPVGRFPWWDRESCLRRGRRSQCVVLAAWVLRSGRWSWALHLEVLAQLKVPRRATW